MRPQAGHEKRGRKGGRSTLPAEETENPNSRPKRKVFLGGKSGTKSPDPFAREKKSSQRRGEGECVLGRWEKTMCCAAV